MSKANWFDFFVLIRMKTTTPISSHFCIIAFINRSLMLQNRLAYFNIFFIMAYLLVYLQSGSFVSSTGGIAIILFSWLGLRSHETENYNWKWWHYIVALWTLYFVGTVLYGTFNVILPAIEYAYADNSTIIYISMSLILSISNVSYFLLYFKENL